MNKKNCYDAMIFSAGNILLPHCDLSYYFLDAIRQKYYKGSTSKVAFEDLVKKDNENIILENYYGLCVKREIVENRATIEKKIEHIVTYEKKPIGILMDSYYIPWNKLKFQLHRTHCFLITDILNDNYICIDTYLSENKVFIDKKTLIENVGMLFYFDYDETIKKENSLSDLILYLKNYISIEHKIHIEKINEFADDILRSKFDTIEQIDYTNIEQSNLIIFIANVEWSRNNFSSALKLAKKNFNTSIFDEIIPLLDESYVMWGTLKSLMIKNVFIRNNYEKASKLVRTIGDKENKAMELLLNIYIPD